MKAVMLCYFQTFIADRKGNQMNIDRNKIIKALSILAALFICVTGLSTMLRHNSRTLTEYAQENPIPEKSAPENPASKNSASENSASEKSAQEKPEDLPTTSEAEKPDTLTESDATVQSSLTGAILNGESMIDVRVDYMPSFYYEPLSEDLKRYITGISFPADVQGKASESTPADEAVISFENLRYVHIMHYNFDGQPTEGELICNESIAQDLVEIFYELYRNEYHIEKVVLIDEYDGDDVASMEDNNTSCFNYRVVEGSTSLSKHAYGLALDINPLYNPYITYQKDGSENVSPASGSAYVDRSTNFPYKIDENDLCYKLFTEHGFIWGGNWNSCKDYQHFQKVKE